MLNSLTAVIPFYNGHEHIDRLVDSLPTDLPVLLVDDLSDDPLNASAFISSHPEHDITVHRLTEKGYFAGAVNAGIEMTIGDVLVLNQDVSFDGDGWLDFVAGAVDAGHGIAGDGVFGHPAWPNGYVQGTFMYLSRSALDVVGLFDVERYPLWGCTAEWQVRAARAGFSAHPIKPVPGMVHARDERPYGDGISHLLKTKPELRQWLIRTPPLVSIIVTSYNYGRYLPDAINSLIGGPTSIGDAPGQTVGSFEVIIVNDASQDETAEVGQALADPWKGIHYIELPPSKHHDGLPNNGTPVANNAGIKASYGTYITLLCADDMYDPKRLEMLLPIVERDPTKVAYDDMMIFSEGKLVRRRTMEEYDFERLIHRNQVHAGILFHRKAWDQVGGYPQVMRYGREDWAFNVALGIAGYCGVRVDYPGYLYRRESQGRTMRNASGEWRKRFVNQMHNLFPLLYSGERPMGCCGGRGSNMRNKGKMKSTLGAAGTIQAGDFAGTDGMVLLEYLGKNDGTQLWKGAGYKKHEFGLTRKFGYVTAEDADYMIRTYWSGNRPVFRVAQQPTAEVPVPVPEAEAVNPAAQPEEQAPVTAVVSEETPPEEPEMSFPDPGDYTVKKLEEEIAGSELTVDQLRAMKAAEESGGNRVGAIDAIEAAINDAVAIPA